MPHAAWRSTRLYDLLGVRYVLGSKEVTLDWDKSSLAFNADPEVDSGAEGYLFLSDPFYPGWQAELDGEPVPILRADYAFRAVATPAGSGHTVTMTFRPASW